MTKDKSFLLFHETINELFMLVNRELVDTQNNIIELKILLDKLSLIYHSTSLATAKDSGNPKRLKYDETRKSVTKQFPSLGLYNIPQEIAKNPGQTNLLIGDAIDDITDLICDLSEVAWHLDNRDEQNALWLFRFGYESHWGKHLHALRLYLYSLCYEQ